MACGNCHTPKDAQGRAIAGQELAGGGIGFDIPPFAGVAANITPDRETGIGTWSDDEIKRAITHGERPARGALAGKPLAVPMAANFFKAILPGDLDAIVAYLRSVPAVRRELPAPIYRGPVRREAFALADRGFTARDLGRSGAARRLSRDDRPLPRMPYAAGKGHAPARHRARRRRPAVPARVRQGAAGELAGRRVAQCHVASVLGLGAWSDAEIKRAITQGVGRDGRKLQEPMPFAWYAGIRADDLDAIVAYLRTLPPLPR